MKEAYEKFVQTCQKQLGWKNEEFNTWEDLTSEQQTAFEREYTFLIASNDAAGAEKRFKNHNNYE